MKSSTWLYLALGFSLFVLLISLQPIYSGGLSVLEKEGPATIFASLLAGAFTLLAAIAAVTVGFDRIRTSMEEGRYNQELKLRRSRVINVLYSLREEVRAVVVESLASRNLILRLITDIRKQMKSENSNENISRSEAISALIMILPREAVELVFPPMATGRILDRHSTELFSMPVYSISQISTLFYANLDRLNSMSLKIVDCKSSEDTNTPDGLTQTARLANALFYFEELSTLCYSFPKTLLPVRYQHLRGNGRFGIGQFLQRILENTGKAIESLDEVGTKSLFESLKDQSYLDEDELNDIFVAENTSAIENVSKSIDENIGELGSTKQLAAFDRKRISFGFSGAAKLFEKRGKSVVPSNDWQVEVDSLCERKYQTILKIADLRFAD